MEIFSLIVEAISRRRARRRIEERVLRGNPEKALAILESLKSLPPEPGDEMPTANTGRRDHR